MPDLTITNVAAGQAVPVKWQITDANGVAISDPKSFVSVTVRGTNTACAGTIDPIESYTGSSGVQYLGGGNWQANWATPKAYAGSCKTMVLTLNDGVNPASGDPRTAYFQFK